MELRVLPCSSVVEYHICDTSNEMNNHISSMCVRSLPDQHREWLASVFLSGTCLTSRSRVRGGNQEGAPESSDGCKDDVSHCQLLKVFIILKWRRNRHRKNLGCCYRDSFQHILYTHNHTFAYPGPFNWPKTQGLRVSLWAIQREHFPLAGPLQGQGFRNKMDFIYLLSDAAPPF